MYDAFANSIDSPTAVVMRFEDSRTRWVLPLSRAFRRILPILADSNC
jgi:hypothetical protein